MKKKIKILCVVLALTMSATALSSCSAFGYRDNYRYSRSGYSNNSEYTRGSFTDAYGNYYPGGYFDRYGNFYPDDYYNYDTGCYEGYFDSYGEWHYN